MLLTQGLQSTPLATTKSTVVGIRLDHDRRAWVEGEAARLGVSVRGLFEGMIDEARLGEKADADRAIAGLGSATPNQATGQLNEESTATAGPETASTVGQPGPVNTPSGSAAGTPQTSSPWPNLRSIAGLPVGLLRGAFSLTAGMIESGGRCAVKRIESCALTRSRGERSV